MDTDFVILLSPSKLKKKLKFSDEHMNVAGRGLDDISGTAGKSDNTVSTEWSQKEGRDR